MQILQGQISANFDHCFARGGRSGCDFGYDYEYILTRKNRRLWIPIFSHILSLVILADYAMTDQILTLKEVAAYLKLAEKTAYKLAAEGKLPGFKVGGSWRFKESDIQAWIDEKKKENA